MRDRGLIPNCTILAVGNEAVHREGMEVKPDTASISTYGSLRAKYVLVGEGSSKDSKESMDTARLIPKLNSRDNFGFEIEKSRYTLVRIENTIADSLFCIGHPPPKGGGLPLRIKK